MEAEVLFPLVVKNDFICPPNKSEMGVLCSATYKIFLNKYILPQVIFHTNTES